MKVHAFRSVGAKLFYYMSLLVLLTVVGNSFQYIRTFMAYQSDQVQDQVQLSAERAASQFENAIDTWRSQITVALPTLRSVDAKSASPQIQRFVDSSPEFLSLDLVEAPSTRSTKLTTLGNAFTSATTDPRFEDKVPSKIRGQIQASSRAWLKRQIPKAGKTNVLVETLAKGSGLPIMTMAVRFDVDNSPSVVWAILSVWQTNLIKALPKSKFIDSAVIDANGKVFTSPNVFEMVNRKTFAGAALAKSALAGTSPAGFEPEYKDAEGQRRLGAYARLPKYALAVLIEQDAEAAYQTLRKNLLTTALVAVLFILFAVMFAYVGAQGITKGLRAVAEGTSKIAAGDFKHEIELESQDEVGALAQDVNNMSRKIQTLMKSQVEKARIEQELETAKMVQSTFFPRSEIRNGPLFVTGFYQPASECGGDLWGRFPIADGVEFLFVADAMGHGAPAALVTAMAYSTTMTVADIVKDRNDVMDSPARVLERLNRIIYEAVRGTISMTFFASIIDTNRGTITYANAGHNFPVLLPATPNDPRAGKQRPISKEVPIQPVSLKATGTPLGMEADVTFQDKTMDLRPGDKLLYFTDGLIECSSPKGEVWGRKYLLEQAVETSVLSALDMKDELLSRAFTFFGTKPLDDDVTVVVIELAKSWQPKQSRPSAEAPTRRAPPPPPMPMPLPVAAVDSSAAPELDDLTFVAIPQVAFQEAAAVDPVAPSSEPMEEVMFSLETTSPGLMPETAPEEPEMSVEATEVVVKEVAPVPETAKAPEVAPAARPMAAEAPAPGPGKYRLKLRQ